MHPARTDRVSDVTSHVIAIKGTRGTIKFRLATPIGSYGPRGRKSNEYSRGRSRDDDKVRWEGVLSELG